MSEVPSTFAAARQCSRDVAVALRLDNAVKTPRPYGALDLGWDDRHTIEHDARHERHPDLPREVINGATGVRVSLRV